MSVNRRDFIKRAGTSAALIAVGSGFVKGSAFGKTVNKASDKNELSFVGSSTSGIMEEHLSAGNNSVIWNG